MVKRTTIKDVAAKAGVSTALVSMVLHCNFDENGKPDCKIRKETAERILAVVREMGYIPNSAAASIRTGRTRTVAVITSDISSRFFSEICRLIENRFYEQGYNVIFASSDENAKKFSNITKSVMGCNVDGMIILPPPHADKVFDTLSSYNIPIVLLERNVPSFTKAGRVLLDIIQSVRLQIDSLYASGYRKIHALTYDMEVSSITEKVEAYRRLMKETGLEDEINVHYLPYMAQDDEMIRVITDARKSGAEAFVLLSNDVTTHFARVIKKLKLHTPEDVAFVGFENSVIYDLFDNPVSYITEPKVELADNAAAMLLGMMEREEKPSTVILSPRMVEGVSSRKKSL